MPIGGIHALIFSKDPGAVRAFLRDVLELDSVDAGGGWLIFALPPAELGVHPTEDAPHHELYLMCRDLDTTISRLRDRGAQFSGPVEDQRFGRVASLLLPDGQLLALYEPRHPTAVPLD
jgi:predicted enzyme related to lactoylglutathione lyase